MLTGSGRRRESLAEEKARIAAESYETAERVSAVTRPHALCPQQVFAWRRAARLPLAEPPAAAPLLFRRRLNADAEAGCNAAAEVAEAEGGPGRRHDLAHERVTVRQAAGGRQDPMVRDRRWCGTPHYGAVSGAIGRAGSQRVHDARHPRVPVAAS